MEDKKYNVAVVGATGVVGELMLSILNEREFPYDKAVALASEDSVGKKVMMGSKPLTVQSLADFDFDGIDFVFFAAGKDVSAQYVPKAAAAGAMVIDNSSAFRYDDDVPLIVPEVNAALLADLPERRIIANPNCSTIQMVVVLNPIAEMVGVERVNVATYQAVSGCGSKAIEELARQTATLLNGQEVAIESLPHQIAFNVFPQIDEFEENGYTREEMKMVWETQKIMNDPNIKINATAVRVPVFYGHSEALHIETKEFISQSDLLNLLESTPGIKLMQSDYPTPVTHAASQDDIFVGRVRQDVSHPNGINLWVVADNVRKGAALNAVQIAELLVNRDRVLH